MKLIRVALDIPLPRLFDYLAPDAQESDIGRLVSVPFGSGNKIGVVLALTDVTDQPVKKLKTVQSILREIPPLPASFIALCEFCARYYQAPLGEVMAFALPPMLRRGKLPRMRAAVSNNGVSRDEATLNGVSSAPTGELPTLLVAQAQAVDAILAAKRFQTFLLHGITGSGKTEVYLRAIAAVLARGGQALMLVPEIALTPQLQSRVAARFPNAHIVAAHSGVPDAARARGFLEALEGRADIVLGTRLSIFMPLPRLQIIVVDEEHDGSFKQQDGLRYSARDLAIWRAQQLAIPVVLGSATPTLETFFHAHNARYRLLELPLRAVAKNLPTVRAIDTRSEKLKDGLSQALIDALAVRLERGEQSLIFLNRRGYAPVLSCPPCGWVSRCHRCAANLVVHLTDKRLRCHHCGFEAMIPRACPSCGNVDLKPFGRGTQRLEHILAERFPSARISRIDRDSASTPKKWQTLLDAIHAGEVDILVGTQMLAKGHDFPRLTLVGAISADAALFAADFRAPERLFAQLMQVGGRSGRADLPGEVLIQTDYPDHALYLALEDGDYGRFARVLLAEREIAGFPPYSFQALLRAEARTVEDSIAFLSIARNAALAMADCGVTVYDPVPMKMQRLMALERAQLLVESINRPALQAFLARWMETIYTQKKPVGLRWHLDVDPLEI
ncbi:MAG: primosomal protein N' [Rhodocyclaceae bacterium]|nr:primosomal protein N' [Rhodocyclaceae bacterium]MBP6279630.1 primosomal protein N' [Rhodocyclaceae bacterium]